MLRQVRFPKVKRTFIPSLDLINPTILILIKLQLLTFTFSSWFLKFYLHQCLTKKFVLYCEGQEQNKIKKKQVSFLPFGLEFIHSSSEHCGRLLMGLAVAKSRLRSGKHKPRVQRPSIFKSFCNSGFTKIKVFIQQRCSSAPFHRSSNIYKDLLGEAANAF